MTLRLKVVLALVALSLAATVAVGTWSYVATRDNLYSEVNRSLDHARTEVIREVDEHGSDATPFIVAPNDGDETTPTGRPRPRSFEQIVVQHIARNGSIDWAPSSGRLPVDDRDRALASSARAGATIRRDRSVDDELFRVDTIALGGTGGAMQVARSLAETDRLLDSLLDRTLVAMVLVAAGAATAGWFVARGLTRRLAHLTATAEQVAATGALDIEAQAGGSDEAARLARAFNAMLGALAASRRAQHQLVQDAGHELRTPLTSLRTNIRVLRRIDDLSPDDVSGILDDLDSETRELSDLVNEIVELATERRDDEPMELCSLQSVIDGAVVRATRRTDAPIDVDCDDSVVLGQRGALDRCMANLLDNAIKFAPSDAPISITVRAGRVEVADRGPGIPSDELEQVFERFHRSDDARSKPGSGLGLAIVRQTVERHGGSAFAAARPGGGAIVGFALPVVSNPTLTQDEDEANPDRRS